jgi:phospholipase C
MNILTKNPDTWKKTIFIITYDENDGYFDHVPPFVAPSPNEEGLQGKVSEGISLEAEFVDLNEELNVKKISKESARASSIGLGFRVPLLIASPWSRGGKVNSEVLDHTSIIQFLENFLSKKTGKVIKETNISEWRRTICGDLTSAFSPYNGEEIQYPEPVDKDKFIQSIYNARFKELPSGYKLLNASEINIINQGKAVPDQLMPSQEPGIRDSCALPYQMHANGSLSADRKSFSINLKAGNVFGKRSAGVPFLAYATGNYRRSSLNDNFESGKSWAYAVKAGNALAESWELNSFENRSYALSVYGPNGFFRSFEGNSNDPALLINDGYRTALNISKAVEDKLVLKIANNEDKKLRVTIQDKSYGSPAITKELSGGQVIEIDIDTAKNHGWYDFILRVEGYDSFIQHFAGRVETGELRKTDPVMGRINKI